MLIKDWSKIINLILIDSSFSQLETPGTELVPVTVVVILSFSLYFSLFISFFLSLYDQLIVKWIKNLLEKFFLIIFLINKWHSLTRYMFVNPSTNNLFFLFLFFSLSFSSSFLFSFSLLSPPLELFILFFLLGIKIQDERDVTA